MLQRLHISGYRSLFDFDCQLQSTTVISGKNGVGKSNFYKALVLVKALASGSFAESIAKEGGMQSALWAGDRKVTDRKTIHIELRHSEFIYSVEIGLIQSGPSDPSLFKSDPEIKEERIAICLPKSERIIAKRKGTQVMLSENAGPLERYEFPVLSNESILSQIKNPAKFPFLSLVRDTILEWRFFHEFDTNSSSPLRQPQVSYYSPYLQDDGSNLLSAIQTILESNNDETLMQLYNEAFPHQSLSIDSTANRFHLKIYQDDLQRPLSAAELSDGTLRFLCLLASLLSPQPSNLLIFNEPEMSLNASLYPVLTKLLTKSDSQLIVVSHDQELADQLHQSSMKSVELMTQNGKTIHQSHRGANKVWEFD